MVTTECVIPHSVYGNVTLSTRQFRGFQFVTYAVRAAAGITHFVDLYGQMIEYLRMNGIVLPVSRGNK